jgi:hypothetical protein
VKVTLECAHCLLERAINQVKLATDDPETQMNVTAAMLDFLSKSFNMKAVPSHIGTDRDLLVQEMTGRDPYEELKRISNVMALDILPELMNRLIPELGSGEPHLSQQQLTRLSLTFQDEILTWKNLEESSNAWNLILLLIRWTSSRVYAKAKRKSYTCWTMQEKSSWI